MTIRELLEALNKIANWNTPILLTITNDVTGIDQVADLRSVTLEQDHGTEEMFLRLYGDTTEDE
jgi:hypothetical protein